MIMNKRFAIFDMDGTLVDSMGYWKSLGDEYLTSKVVRHNATDILKRTEAMSMLESATLFIKEFGITGTPESVAEEMNDLMNHHYLTDIPLKPGVQQYLDTLRHHKVRMCVASATAGELIRSCLNRLGVADYFDFMLSCETIGISKEQPDIFYACAKQFGAAPEDIAVYEDALYAASTAKKAGFHVIGIYDTVSDHRWEKLKELADEIIPDWETAQL